MNGLLVLLALIVCVSISVFIPTDGPPAIIVCTVLASAAGLVISRIKNDSTFLLQLFVGGLLIRILVGTAIFVFGLQAFFGGDANTYDYFGDNLVKAWGGDKYYWSLVGPYINIKGAPWGMIYMVAAVYGLIGRNMLAIQFINATLGAATAPIIFLCSRHIFNNVKAARIAAMFVALYPSLVLWSSQGLKDGPIVFLLATSMLATLKLGDKFNAKSFIVLVGCLAALLSLRFYIFYMVVAAVGGAFVIGMRAITAQSFARQFIIVIGIGLSFTYLGILRNATSNMERFANLELLQASRQDASQSAASGFGKDVDVSTTSGAITAIPTGMVYLLFAPFPWQLASLRQSITLPEMVVWWASFPTLVLGIWFTIKYRLRQASPILIFTTMLTLSYSVFQGNVGNAYRQRAQLLVFYFIFVAVGFVLLKEKREDRNRRAQEEALAQRTAPALNRRLPTV